MRRFLIITADDFGLHEAVNEAVQQASEAGALTSASLMVGAPAAADAIRRARMLPGLRVGLHLVLAEGRATLPHELIPDLTDEGGQMSGDMFLRAVRFIADRGTRRQLEAEIRAQFSEFSRSGLPLDHVNVHKHFHLHPTLLDMLLRIGRDFGIASVRVPAEPLWFASKAGGWAGVLRGALLSPWTALMKRRLRSAGVSHNDHLFGIAASGGMNEATLLTILARLPPGITEIYMHPAVQSGRAITESMHGYRHAEELAALMSPRVRATIALGRYELGGFADALRAHGAPAA
jgi:hopanoid biosynthesis associated protein HpnK